MTFFVRFVRKSAQTFTSTALSPKSSWFYRKRENVICFPVLKISTPTDFMRLRSKLTSEICQKVRIDENWLKMYNFHFFSRKATLKKEEKRYFIFYYKYRNTCQFYVFTIKNDFGNMAVSGEFGFENSLKTNTDNSKKFIASYSNICALGHVDIPLSVFMCATAILKMVNLSGFRAKALQVGTMSDNSVM